jgi:hypothetical protein
MKTETAYQKIDNLEKLGRMLAGKEAAPTIHVDEDGFYYIGERMFTDFRAAKIAIAKDTWR